MFLLILLFCVMAVDAQFGKSLPITAQNYGPYTVEWESFYPCRGPKTRNLTVVSTNLTRNDKEEYICNLNLTFLEEARLDEVRVSVYTKSFEDKNLLWHYKFHSPCQQFVLTDYIKKQFGLGRHCQIKKGLFTAKLNFSQMSHQFHGSSFFYGHMLFKTIATANKGNVICFIFHLTYKKKE